MLSAALLWVVFGGVLLSLYPSPIPFSAVCLSFFLCCSASGAFSVVSLCSGVCGCGACVCVCVCVGVGVWGGWVVVGGDVGACGGGASRDVV